MFDVLDTLHTATCKNCNGPISFMKGSLVGGDWYHDESGQKPCPGAPYAWPIDSTIENVPQAPTSSVTAPAGGDK